MRRLMVLLCFLLLGISFHGVQAATSYCLRLFQTPSFTDKIILSTQTLNLQTGKLTADKQPSIPPTSAFSIDGKYAAFLEIIHDLKVGLYVASIDTNQSTLLTEYDMGQDANILPPRPLIWRWSPNSDKLAYVSQHVLYIYDAGTRKTQQAAIKGVGGLIMMDGWSADGMYIAVTTSTAQAAELNIFSADAHRIQQFAEALGSQDEEYGAVAWSLHGHRIAVTVNNKPVQLIAWSPENGIIASTNVDPYELGGYFSLRWLPGERYLLLQRDQDLGYYNDYVFGFDGKNLYQAPEPKIWRYVIGATPDGGVILLDASGQFDTYEGYLYVLKLPSGIRRNLDTDVVEPYGSGSFRLVSSPDESHFIFFTERKNLATAYAASMDGKHINQISDTDFLSNFNSNLYDLTWSPHGKYAAIRVWGYEPPHSNKSVDFLSVFVTPDGKIQRTVAGLLGNWIDDNFIDYGVWDGNQLKSAVIMNIDTGKSWEISPIYFPFAVISPDKTILAISNSDDQLGLLALKDKATVIPISVNSVYSNGYKTYLLSWSPDSSALAFIDGDFLKIVRRDGTLLREVKIELQATPLLQWMKC